MIICLFIPVAIKVAFCTPRVNLFIFDFYKDNNPLVSFILEVLSDKLMQLGKSSTIKEQITISSFKNDLSVVKKAIKIYKVFG